MTKENGLSMDAVVASWCEGYLDGRHLPDTLTVWDFNAGTLEDLRHLTSGWDIPRLAKEVAFVSSRRETKGVTEIFKVPGDVAAEMYNDGFPLVIGEHRLTMNLASAFARFLGLPEKYVTCNVFASKTGGKAQKHFDPVMSLAFQMVGTKRWSVQDNEWVPNPLCGYLVGESPRDKLRLCTEGPPNLNSERGPVTVERCPGEAILVPAGYWHATEALGESVSINLHVHSKTWADWLVEAVGDVLRQKPQWRQPLPREPEDLAVFQMLENFQRVTEALVPKDLCGPADVAPVRRCGLDTAFRRIATSLFGVESADEGECVIYVNRFFGTRRLDIVLPPRLLAASRWLARQEGRITPRSVVARFSELTDEDACGLLANLEGVGLLRRE